MSGNKSKKDKHKSPISKQQQRRPSDYNIESFNQYLNHFSDHAPAAQKVQQETLSSVVKSKPSNGLDTGASSHDNETLTDRSDYLHLDEKIDGQTQRIIDTERNLSEKIESVKESVLSGDRDVRKDLEDKIAEAKAENKNHINTILTFSGIIFTVLSIIVGLVATCETHTIYNNIDENNKTIKENRDRIEKIEKNLIKIQDHIDATKDSL